MDGQRLHDGAENAHVMHDAFAVLFRLKRFGLRLNRCRFCDDNLGLPATIGEHVQHNGHGKRCEGERHYQHNDTTRHEPILNILPLPVIDPRRNQRDKHGREDPHLDPIRLLIVLLLLRRLLFQILDLPWELIRMHAFQIR